MPRSFYFGMIIAANALYFINTKGGYKNESINS